LLGVEFFPTESAGKIQRNLQNEIVFVVVRQSVLFVDLDVSESQTTNSANQQQKIIMSSHVTRHTLCPKKLDPFFTNQTFNSSSHSGWSLMFGEDLKTV
jgi:3-dehydroquinate dehydratase